MQPPDAGLLKRINIVRARIATSVSGFVLLSKFGTRDRTALKHLIVRGEAEMFDSKAGRAYRLTGK